MNNQKKKTPSIHLGTSSLLVVFLVLCFAVFAALSLSTAKRDAQASEQLARRRNSYYEVCNQAETIVQSIDQILKEAYELQENWLREAIPQIEALGQSADSFSLEVSFSEDIPIVSWQLPMGENQALAVELLLQEPDAEGRLYRIIRWQTISLSDWEGSNTLSLIPFEE